MFSFMVRGMAAGAGKGSVSRFKTKDTRCSLHSYGGMVVSGVADRVPERIRALIYLDAFVPANGDSLVKFAPIAGDRLVDGWKCRPIEACVFGVNPLDRSWVDRQCTMQSLACFEQPLGLTGGIERVRRVSYIYASGWAGYQSPFFPFYEGARSRGWRVSEIPCGHDVMIDRPEELTALLLE